jgi:polygalacturonase
VEKQAANMRDATGRAQMADEQQSACRWNNGVFGDGDNLRPNFIQFNRCQNVLIEGVKIRRSPMWEIHPLLCTNVTVRGVDIFSHGANNDGCDPESCRDVLIEKVPLRHRRRLHRHQIRPQQRRPRVGVPSVNLIIRDCTMRDGHAGTAIGSEISGSCSNVFVENCEMSSPNLVCALRLKSNADARRRAAKYFHAQRERRPGERFRFAD